jgi:hypothetical protein
MYQGKLDFLHGCYDRHAVSVMVGEFYELLSEKIFGATRLDPILARYRRWISPIDEGDIDHDEPERKGYFFPPDLYCPTRRVGWEIKGAQRRTAHPLRVDQLTGFQNLLAHDTRFDRIEYVFFRYDTHEALNKKDIHGIIDILTEKTCLMASVDSKIITALTACAERWDEKYIVQGKSRSAELYRIKQKFFDDLVERPLELMKHLGLPPESAIVREPKEEVVHFFEKEMRFRRIEVLVKEKTAVLGA